MVRVASAALVMPGLSWQQLRLASSYRIVTIDDNPAYWDVRLTGLRSNRLEIDR